jgi:hypothetical protein
MKRAIACLALTGVAMLTSCSKQDTTAEAPKSLVETAAAPQPAGAPHVVVHLNDGSKVPGTIVASTQTDMVVAGDDGIERKIPVGQVKSVDCGQTPAAPKPVQQASREPAPPPVSPRPAPLPPPTTRAITTRTNELPVGSEVSVRMNEPIDSATAAEGQTFDAQVTRDAKDAEGEVVIPRGSRARVVIKSASAGGKFHGASDLVLDLQSINVDGKTYSIGTADMVQKGRSNVGINKRTAEFTGGGAALGAVIGAIAGGGKAAAIGAGAGAGAGALTQIITKGGSIKVPVEAVLTFSLDKPLRVRVVE